MALMIVMSTGDFQIRWNVLSLSFSERESENGLLGLVIFIISILSVMTVFSTLERYSFVILN